MIQLDPVVLEGTTVRLEPLDQEHAAPLWAVGNDPEIWRWIPFAIHSEDDLRRLIAGAQHLNQAGSGLGYAMIVKATGEPVGASGYWNAASHDKSRWRASRQRLLQPHRARVAQRQGASSAADGVILRTRQVL